MIRKLEHIALGVSDINRSLKFYRDLLGMKVVFETDLSDDKIGRINGIIGSKCKITHLQIGETILELIHYYALPIDKFSINSSQCNRGFIHIGFNVTDIHTHVKELKEKGIEFLGELVELRPGTWCAYFRGPDGEVCELRQVPD